MSPTSTFKIRCYALALSDFDTNNISKNKKLQKYRSKICIWNIEI